MDIPRPNVMHSANDFCVHSNTHHQECSSTIDDCGVEESNFPALNRLSQPATATMQAQISGQEILCPKWQDRDGNSGMSIHDVSHSPITAGRNDASQSGRGWPGHQITIQLFAIRKHPNSKPGITQMAGENDQLSTASPGTRMRIPLDDDKLIVNGFETDLQFPLRKKKHTPEVVSRGVYVV